MRFDSIKFAGQTNFTWSLRRLHHPKVDQGAANLHIPPIHIYFPKPRRWPFRMSPVNSQQNDTRATSPVDGKDGLGQENIFHARQS